MANTFVTKDTDVETNVDTLIDRITAARAGYLDELAAANIPADVDTVLARLTATRAGYLDNLSGGAVAKNSDMATVLTRLSAARAGYLDALNRDRPNMIFPSGTPKAIVVLPGAAADIDFPDVVVSGLPSGITIARADFVLVIGALFDTSASENQINVASKTLRVKLSSGAWGTNDIVALTFVQNSLQCDGDAYRGGPVLFGATDIKSVVTADGTYNFRSEQTNRSEGVTVTAASPELLDVSGVIRVWFN